MFLADKTVACHKLSLILLIQKAKLVAEAWDKYVQIFHCHDRILSRFRPNQHRALIPIMCRRKTMQNIGAAATKDRQRSQCFHSRTFISAFVRFAIVFFGFSYYCRAHSQNQLSCRLRSVSSRPENKKISKEEKSKRIVKEKEVFLKKKKI